MESLDNLLFICPVAVFVWSVNREAVGMESLDHLLFICPVAVFVWSVNREAVGWPDVPSSVLDLISLGKLSQNNKFALIWTGAAAVMWSLWTIRNKLILEAKILKHPADAVFRVIFFLQLWRPLWEEEMGKFFEEMIQECRRKLKRLKTRLNH
ncbi:hypothetical protein ACQ4PT_011271 [Festuca glaucescens]